MSTNVSDPSANRNNKIANAAKVIGRSKDRKKVFLTIYTGKKKVKTVSDLLVLSKLKNKVRVLQEAKELFSEDIIKKLPNKIKNETAYEKIDFYTRNKDTIIRLVNNKKKLEKFPTNVNPQFSMAPIKVQIPKNFVSTQQVYIDDLFPKVKKLKSEMEQNTIYESEIKDGLKKIIGESGNFTDWGGETNDLFSTCIKINGKRKCIAFGLKGKGTKGKLTPKKMGKNGDQLQRLFKSPADILVVQYYSQIDESILDLMKTLAITKSVTENKKIYFGIIDGQDTSRLVKAYPKEFA